MNPFTVVIRCAPPLPRGDDDVEFWPEIVSFSGDWPRGPGHVTGQTDLALAVWHALESLLGYPTPQQAYKLTIEPAKDWTEGEWPT